MRKPYVCNDHLGVRLQPRLDAARLPVPKYDIAGCVATADPLAIRGETDFTCITCNLVIGKPFFTVLTEIVRAVDQDLIIKGLGGEVFLCKVC